jgi:hypothetical protein
MEFREYAARETSALVGRLLAGVSEKSARDLQALRQALDKVTGAIDAALASETNPECGDELTGLAERLTAQAATQAEAASEQARKEAQATIDQLRAALQAQSTENTGLTASLTEAQAQADRLGLELQSQKNLTDAARAECARAEDAQKRIEAARLEIEAALEKARRESGAIKDELHAVQELLESTRAESARFSAQRDAEAAQSEKLAAALSVATTGLQATEAQRKDLLAQVKTSAAQLDAASAAATTLRERAEAAERETERIRAEAELAAQAGAQAARAAEEAEARAGGLLVEQTDTIRQHAAAFLSASLDRLLAMYLSVASGATVDDVLAAVVEALAVQFSRVALFRVQGNHLEGVRQIGFDLRADISQVLIPRTLDSLLTQAVASARIETRSASELADTSGTPFGGTPDFALALPIVIDGQSLAVVYADDSDQPHREFAKSELRLKFAQLLQCQAVPLLTRLSAEAKALAELDEYATLLVNELEQTYAADVKVAGETSDAERRKRLRDDIEYARRLYAQRAASEGPRAAALFEQRLLAVVEGRSATPFGRDIVAAIGGRKRAARASAAGRGAAEAAGNAAS